MDMQVFRKGYESHLANGIGKNRASYCSDKVWADRPGESVPSGIEVPDDIGSLVRGGQERDVHNSHLIHRLLPLTPAQAESRCLWARLAHVELYPYIRERWAPELHAPLPVGTEPQKERERKELKFDQFVKRRLFVIKRNSRHLMRHGIARLWWAAQLTRNGDSYRDTEALLWMPEIAERQYGQYPLVLRTLLRFITSTRKSLIERGVRSNLRSAYFRPLLKRFNECGGSIQLGQLSQPAIESILDSILDEIERRSEAVAV